MTDQHLHTWSGVYSEGDGGLELYRCECGAALLATDKAGLTEIAVEAPYDVLMKLRTPIKVDHAW